MAKKQDSFYFDNFLACAELACEAAHLLEKVMDPFDPDTLSQKLEEIHAVEHAADKKKHEMLDVLAKAFITPIEREDIIQMSHCIDNITDKVEDVMLRIYYNNIRTMQPDALKLANIVVRCCESVRDMLVQFADFKHAKALREHIVNINSMEEEADKLFIASMYTLHTTCTDPLVILSWREIYIYLEKCADACEHVADVVESIVMKNS